MLQVNDYVLLPNSFLEKNQSGPKMKIIELCHMQF